MLRTSIDDKYEFKISKEFKRRELRNAGFDFRSASTLYVLPNGDITDLELRYANLNLKTEGVERVNTKYHYIFLLSPKLPAFYVFERGIDYTNVLDESLTNVLYHLHGRILKAIKIDSFRFLVIDAKKGIKVKLLYDTRVDEKLFGYTNEFKDLIEIAANQYVATFYGIGQHDNIISFHLVDAPNYSGKSVVVDHVYLPTPSYSNTYAAKEYTDILSLVNIGNGIFASLHLDYHNNSRGVPHSMINIWDDKSHSCMHSIKLSEYVGNIQLAPDGKSLIAYGTYGLADPVFGILCIDIQSGHIQKFDPSLLNDDPILRKIKSYVPLPTGDALIELGLDRLLVIKANRLALTKDSGINISSGLFWREKGQDDTALPQHRHNLIDLKHA